MPTCTTEPAISSSPRARRIDAPVADMHDLFSLYRAEAAVAQEMQRADLRLPHVPERLESFLKIQHT
ncbi:MAG TPA: hypothetical protein VFA99_17075 [Acidobacteriaceae bacterium]|nr:hypothetical protein [Acidobacteriaceae bacterium]